MGTSKRRRRILKDYVTNGRKTTLIGNNVGTSLRRIIASLGRLGLSGMRYQAFLCRRRKVHHLHLLLQTRGVLTSIQAPPLLLCLPLKYSRSTLLHSICHHRLGGKQQPRVGRNDGVKTIKRNERKPMATQQLLLK